MLPKAGEAPSQLANKLTAHWSFDESSGYYALDSSKAKNTGRLLRFDDTTAWSNGQIAGALQFERSGSAVVIAHNDSLNIGPEATIAFWIKPTSFGLSEKAGTYARRSSFVVRKGTHFGVRIVDDPGSVRWTLITRSGVSRPLGGTVALQGEEAFAPEDSVELGVWQHFAIVYEKETVSFFKNGKMLGNPVPARLGERNSEPVVIGNYNQGQEIARPFDGQIDDLAIWKRSLTPSEIEGIYLNGIRGRSMTLSVLGFELSATGQARILFSSPFAEREYAIERKTNLPDSGWVEQADVDFVELKNGTFVATFPQQRNKVSVYRIVALPHSLLFADDFESDEIPWQHGGSNDQWELGIPTRGPSQAHSGVNVYATSLSWPVSRNTDDFLRSPMIDLTNVSDAILTFWEYREIDPDTMFQHAIVRVLDATTLEVMEELSRNAGGSQRWLQRSLRLGPQSLCRRIILEFRLVTDAPNRLFDGWYLDDVTVTISGP